MTSRRIDTIVLHCTDSLWGSVESIRRWHTQERGWSDIGYHYLITNCYPTFEDFKQRKPNLQSDGRVHIGRDPDQDGDTEEHVGAHARGWNSRSIGVALVGAGVYSTAQLNATLRLCTDIAVRRSIPFSRVLGHRELIGVSKTCPELDMDWFRENLAF